jgi:hypothetical protein
MKKKKNMQVFFKLPVHYHKDSIHPHNDGKRFDKYHAHGHTYGT